MDNRKGPKQPQILLCEVSLRSTSCANKDEGLLTANGANDQNRTEPSLCVWAACGFAVVAFDKFRCDCSDSNSSRYCCCQRLQSTLVTCRRKEGLLTWIRRPRAPARRGRRPCPLCSPEAECSAPACRPCRGGPPPLARSPQSQHYGSPPDRQ